MSEFGAPIEAPIANRSAINPLRLASSIIFFITGIAACFNASFPLALDALQHISEYQTQAPVLLLYIVTVFMLPVAALILGIIGLVDRKGNLHFFAALALFIIVGPLSWILQAIYIFALKTWVEIYWTTGPNNYDQLGWSLLGGLTMATALSVVAKLTQKKLPVLAQNWQPTAPAKAAPSLGNETATMSNLPVFALVAAFFVPIAAIILGHISLGQINRGQISNQNRGLAVAGLVLGYVFIALIIIATVLFAIIFALSQRHSYY
jgi:hypothetical protein